MKQLTFVNVLALIAVLVVNYLSNSLPLNGFTPGQLSDFYPNLFTPAGLTFSIWGIIYLLLIVWVLMQVSALFSQQQKDRFAPTQKKIGWLFVLSCVLNISWLFSWHWRMLGLSVCIMVALLLTLIALNLALRKGKKPETLVQSLVYLPFGLYQGWITVALIANVTAYLVGNGIDGGAYERLITQIMVATGTAVAALILLRQRNFGHGFAVAWALLGIYIKRSAVPQEDSQAVAWMAAACAALLCMGMIGLVLQRKK